MKTVARTIFAVVLVFFIFWPWLLRCLDLAWMVASGKWLTYGHWWDALWTDGTYKFWPFYAIAIVFVSSLIWAGLEWTDREKGEKRD
ncbi:hypothetical protein [Propionivibrio sp.]|jgi:hypothetical protein|uniref:hypothetical protein n=1 Tax=Propionivibrio sp. TaxID=2212460 RepID=UPI0039E56953